eukprot:49173-Eustigmatos_ZCMA.PRE.1
MALITDISLIRHAADGGPEEEESMHAVHSSMRGRHTFRVGQHVTVATWVDRSRVLMSTLESVDRDGCGEVSL